MKKSIKKLMALMLSLVMIFGCIPSFTNTACAGEILPVSNKCGIGSKDQNYGYLEMGAGVSAEIGVGTWTESLTITVYPNDGYKLIKVYSVIQDQNKDDLEKRTAKQPELQSDGTYKLGPDGMSGSVDIYAEFDKLTISDIIATNPDFPTTINDAWESDNGYKVFYADQKLNFNSSDGTQNLKWVHKSNKVEYVSDNEYKFKSGTDVHDYVFNLTDGKLTSIENLCTTATGTYKPVLKPIEKICITSSGILATNVQSLKFEVAGDANYTLVEDTKWYKEVGCATPVNAYTTTDPVYKKLELEAKPGYIFLSEGLTFDIPVNDSSEVASNGVKDDGNKYEFVLKKTVSLEHTKSASITFPITAGTTLEQIKNNISITTTATEGLASFVESQLNVFEFGNSERTPIIEPLALDKEYIIQFDIKDTESLAYNEIKVNNQSLEDLGLKLTPEFQINVFYKNLGSTLRVICKFKATQLAPVSSGSKKYKADDKDTAEKISGSGKKGSKRIITPQEGRKVESVIVTDKDGNKYEVTNENDGTYSFIQPGTNVDVQVKYKNRLIELTIGSLDASVDDVNHTLDVVPKVVNDRTMLPIRFVAENLGAKVDWADNAPDTVWITRGDTKIEITLGSDIAKVNGKEYMLDSVAFAENDRTYLPVRFVSEKLNAIVEWNEERPMDVKIYERQ